MVNTAAGLEAEVSRQAAMIAYIDAYRLSACALLLTLLLLPLARRTPSAGLAKAAVVDV
jgi:hypothetical protein